ncbi:MAG: TonB-dependent receptor [candidate division KSB1 bacterium]|nr:TonB-dependent receptor [candidate division KSB1 bacterium]MDZ7366542.1 TonB-dependent receptor [candidate division KSB1 bacterium]MDZ7405975.1 TonB-dependent receptor [candidate division KSB1 bacterium]
MPFVHAGTTGKLAGRVTDKQNQGLPGANVLLVGTKLGAVTDIDGYYTILNIPPGTYRVQFSFIGYGAVVVQNVLIISDNTKTVNAELAEEIVKGEEVVIVAQRPVVETNLTSSVATTTREEIEKLPVQELQDVVNLQAGVVEGHIRGGRLGEVQYQINGVTVNNSFNNSSTIRVDRSLLQEVQVISGTFDAEYGQAMSGVVNAVLKSGSDRFNWNAEVFASDYFFSSRRRLVDDEFKPFAQQNFQLSLSGPAFLPQTTFLLSGRRFIDDGYVYATRRFLPTDSSDFQAKNFKATGDNAEMPLGFNREWSGLVKLSNRSLKNIEASYQALFNKIDGKRHNFAFRFNPDGAPEQNTFSLVHGLDWTHTLSSRTFYNLSLRQNYFDYTDYVYENVFDPRYVDAGPPRSDDAYEFGTAVVQGVDFNRFKQRTNSRVFKAALTSQVTREHLVKIGAEAQVSNVEFGSPGYIDAVIDTITGQQALIPFVARPPKFPGVATYKPVSVAAYVQDQLEWRDLVVRAGVRFEYFDARATVPSDLQNPANAIAGAPESVPKPTTVKTSLAPRLGVSYPISTTAAVFFAYGHFYQFPALGQIFSNANYKILEELQAGGISYGVLGNPDIKPERTTQYEFGYKHALTDFLGLDLSLFYKDIRDLLGVEFISTYTNAEYARLTNVDFGNVLGFTIALDQRRVGIFSTALDYTWQRAQGNSSDPRETATRAEAGEDPRPEQIPLNWDQRHTLNATLAASKPNSFSISAIVRYGSGQPYTPAIGSGFGANLERNSGRKPAFVLVDLRAEKFFKLGGMDMSLFARGFNLLDSRFAFGGFVFGDTGSPDYSLNPAGNRGTLLNPLRYYAPRRLELGLTVNSGL